MLGSLLGWRGHRNANWKRAKQADLTGIKTVQSGYGKLFDVGIEREVRNHGI